MSLTDRPLTDSTALPDQGDNKIPKPYLHEKDLFRYKGEHNYSLSLDHSCPGTPLTLEFDKTYQLLDNKDENWWLACPENEPEKANYIPSSVMINKLMLNKFKRKVTFPNLDEYLEENRKKDPTYGVIMYSKIGDKESNKLDQEKYKRPEDSYSWLYK